MQQLSRLVLKGYKSIKKMDIELNNLNVFIGANGAGKSNFISFFKLINAIANEQLSVFVPKNGFADLWLHYGRKHSDAIEARLEFGVNSYQFTLEPTALNRFIFTDETLTFLGEGDTTALSLGVGHDESNLEKFYNNNIAKHIIPIIKRWQVYHFHDTSRTAKIKKIGSIHDYAYYRSDASNLAAFLYKLKLKHGRQYKAICMTKSCPLFW